MSGNTWVIADPHFGHQGVCNFTQADGVTPLRPWDTKEEMDEALIKNWNDRVEATDRVYLLGDVAMTKRPLFAVMPRLKGRIVLVKGNHDGEKMSVYAQFFDDIRAYVVKKGFIMSHIPIHETSLSRWNLNIHGHMHSNVVMKDGVPDTRYRCVSVEQIGFAPILLSEVIRDAGI